MRELILKLTQSAAVRRVVTALRLHLLGNWWLRHFPVVKRLPASGIRYRARRLDSLALSVEMFDESSLYSVADFPAPIRTFADIGCNVGYFTCWLSHQTRNGRLKGIMVDANPEAVEEARWHAQANGLNDVHAVNGLVGPGLEQGEADFFLHRSNVISTAMAPDDANTSPAWKRIKVPCVSIEKTWAKLFGDEACDLLKVDIEGSEMVFFKAETAFLKQVQVILLEWHKPQVTMADFQDFLGQQGFTIKTVLHEGPQVGTALLVRKAS